MSLVINTNIASLQGQNSLAKTQSQQAQTFQRLSTGLRVNSAKDDAGGLYLAQAQTKDIRGLGMATRNAGDGISMAQTAEGALDQIGQNLQRINELAIQSANGTYSAEARGGLQKEVDQLTQEVNRIIETTEFNGQKLLNKDAKAETLQVSFENNAGSRITTGLEGGIADIQGLDNVSFFGSKETFSAAVNVRGATDDGVVQDAFAKQLGFTGGVTNDGDLTTATAGDELQKQVAQALKNFQGDRDTLGEAIAAEFGDNVAGDIKFKANGIDFTINAKVEADGATGFSIESAKASYGGTNIVLDATTITATAASNFRDNPNEAVGAFEIDTFGVVAAGTGGDIKVSDGNALNSIINGGLNGTLAVDISTQEAAQGSITATRNAIDMVSELRAEFGANQNRFEAVISGNQTYSENLSAARSRIQDADFAVETANLAKLQVLQQAGISALGQANASSQSVLGLL